MLTGCTSPTQRDSTPPTPVAAAVAPTVTVRGPVHPGQANVVVDGAAGGEVHVYVNRHWRGEAPALATDGSATVYVGTLQEEDEVTAQEALCTLGPLSPPERVHTGTIKFSVQPTTVTVGTDVEFAFDTTDAETGQSLFGQIMLNGNPFTYGFNPARLHIDGSPLRFTISLPGYKPTSVEVVVEQPHHPPPPPPAAHGSNLFVQNVWVENDGTVSAQRNDWVSPGEGFTVSVDVGNVGPEPVGAFKVAFTLDGESDGDESVAGIPAAASFSVSHHFGPQSDGSHNVTAEIDSDHVVNDPQRNNNEAFATVRVG
jgi:hypothetical protein